METTKPVLDASHFITRWQRILYGVADLFILLIISILFYSAAVVTTMNATPQFKGLQSDIKSAAEKCTKMYESGHLICYRDGSKVDSTVYAKEMLKYKIDLIDEQSGVKTDYLLYFYVDYATPTLHKNKIAYNYTIKDANQIIYVDDANPDIPMWDVTDLNQTVHLLPAVRVELDKYFKGEATESGQAYYEEYITFMKRNLQKCETVLTNSDEYVAQYQIYADLNNKTIAVYGYSALITFTVLFFLYYLLVPILMKDGRTLGKRFFKVKVVQLDGSQPQKHIIVIRSILQYLCYFFIVMFVPFFQIGGNIVAMPLISAGYFKISMLYVSAFSLVLSVASLIVSLSTENHQSLVDKVLWVTVVKEAPDYQEIKIESENIVDIDTIGSENNGSDEQQRSE